MTDTMTYAEDNFVFAKKSLLKTTQPIDLTQETNVLGFEISGTEPPNTMRKIIFEVDNELYYFKDGQLLQFPYLAQFEEILEYGSTVGELLEIRNIPMWIGKKIYPIIALYAARDTPIMPSIQLSIKVNSFNDIFQREIFSPIYKLKLTGNRAKIISVETNLPVTGRASCVAYARLKNNNVWGDWISTQDCKFQYATEVQFKVLQILTTLNGDDSAKVESIKISYTTDDKKSPAAIQEIFTIPLKSEIDLHKCSVIVRHSPLKDSCLQAFINLVEPSKIYKNVFIGRGDGTLKTFNLNAQNINQDSLQIQINGENAPGFYYNTKQGTIKLSAPQDAEIYASFETFSQITRAELNKVFSKRAGDIFITKFMSFNEEKNKKIAALNLQLTSLSGSVNSQSLGEATGSLQKIFIGKNAENLSCNADFSHDEDAQMLLCQAAQGEEIFVSYDWHGALPKIFKITAGLEGWGYERDFPQVTG